jgi:hypothetical protein
MAQRRILGAFALLVGGVNPPDTISGNAVFTMIGNA